MVDRFGLVVRMRVRKGTIDAFRPLILANARGAESREPDCHQFRVTQDCSDPHLFTFYEEYTDRAALEHHKTTDHYRMFDAAAKPYIETVEFQEVTVIESQYVDPRKS